VSSTYRVLCLNHHPALIAADGDWNRREFAETAIREGITDHATCDLLIGRYSYPLVEVGCPGTSIRPEHTPGCTWHGATNWIDRDWLKLLWHAQQQEGQPLLAAVGHQHEFRCWTPQRLDRIAAELGITPAGV
jgi:hypothetical protein